MKNWKNININKQNIKAETPTAVLISCPNKSFYCGFCFWHPAKLIRDGRHSNAITISYTDDFTFNLKKYNKSRELVDEFSIDTNEFEDMFEITNKNIRSPKQINIYETHKPKKLYPEKVEADASLIDNE